MPVARMHTPSLRVRVIAAGMVTWIVLVISLDVFVFLSLRTQLLDSLEELLDARATLALELGANLPPEQLDARLTELGVPGVVRAADGRRLTADPAAPGFGGGPPGPIEEGETSVVERMVSLPGGASVTVFASRTGVEQTLDQVLLLEAVGSFAVLGLMLILLIRMSTVLLGPIDHVVQTARTIAAGGTGQRLRPDRPDTELGRLASAFDEMLDSLEEAVSQAKSAEREARESEARSRRFLADAAHQLRTPIAALRALVESLLRAEDPEERERLTDSLAREAARTSRLVTSLLEMAKLDRGDAPRFATFDLVGLVLDEAQRANTLSPNLRVVAEPPYEELMVEADPEGIRHAIGNLLDNARRHAHKRIVVRLLAHHDRVEIGVDDDGPGLPPGAEHRAFDRFATFDDHGGTGLGLAIARGIAVAHGGDLAYRDGEFVLRIPLTTGAPPAEPTRSSESVSLPLY